MSRGSNGTNDFAGTRRWLLIRTLIKAISTVYFLALRSANTRLVVRPAPPRETSTLTPNFFLKASKTWRYWRDGAPPAAIDTLPSFLAAAISWAQSDLKSAEAGPIPRPTIAARSAPITGSLNLILW